MMGHPELATEVESEETSVWWSVESPAIGGEKT